MVTGRQDQVAVGLFHPERGVGIGMQQQLPLNEVGFRPALTQTLLDRLSTASLGAQLGFEQIALADPEPDR